MENQIFELGYALDTFYFLVCGALVMWMAAGFAMLEAGLVRAKNTTEILTKNVALFAVACTMYMIVGYGIMYPELGSTLLSGITGDGVAGAEEPANLCALRRLLLSGRIRRDSHVDCVRRCCRTHEAVGLSWPLRL
jgi:hypothetical protein